MEIVSSPKDLKLVQVGDLKVGTFFCAPNDHRPPRVVVQRPADFEGESFVMTADLEKFELIAIEVDANVVAIPISSPLRIHTQAHLGWASGMYPAGRLLIFDAGPCVVVHGEKGIPHALSLIDWSLRSLKTAASLASTDTWRITAESAEGESSVEIASSPTPKPTHSAAK